MGKIIKVFNFIYSKYLGVHIFKCIELLNLKSPTFIILFFTSSKILLLVLLSNFSFFFGYKRKDYFLFCFTMLLQKMN